METIPAPLHGKRALVTGGSRGIGRAIAQTFARHGATHIAITYHSNRAAADETVRLIAEINPKIKVHAFAFDVGDPDAGRLAIEETLRGLEVSEIDIMVSNAAVLDIPSFGTVATLTKETWDRAVTGLAWTPFLLARESSKVMPAGGRIVLVSSIASKVPNGDPLVSYSVGKAALDTVARNLAVAYGVEKGVTVNSISVGPTRTESYVNAQADFADMARSVAERSLLKRAGEPQEVADIVAFVASPQASWVHGNQIPANGGWLSMAQS